MKKVTWASLLAMSAAMSSGAAAGVDPLTQVEPPQSEWRYQGEPDYVVDVPSFTVPATGVIDYVNTNIDLPFEEEKWVKAVQFIPGDKRVLHHLLSYVVSQDSGEEFDEADNVSGFEFLEGYAPGKEYATEYPENTGVKILPSSSLRMSVHYTTFGQETVDETRVGLWLHDEGEEPDYAYHTYSVSAGNRTENINIPAGAMNHEMAATHVFEDAIQLHGFRAHMHYRGKAMSARVIYPDNTSEEIINVPDYNFAWQPTYRTSEPMELPAGSRVVVEGKFDNSEYNPGNPDPTEPALGGLQSWEEMFIGYFSYHDYNDY